MPILKVGFKEGWQKNSQYLQAQIRFMTSDQGNTAAGTDMEEIYLFHTVHKSRNISSENKTAVFPRFESSCTYKPHGVGFFSPDGRHTKIQNLEAIQNWDNNQSLTVVTLSSLSFKLRQQSIYFHSQLKVLLIHSPISITNRLQEWLHYLKSPIIPTHNSIMG
jgi:hypothetical protein